MTAAGAGVVRFLPNGDAALSVEFGDKIDLVVNARVLALADQVAEAAIDGIVETVPTFRALLIRFDPARLTLSGLKVRIERLIGAMSSRARPTRLWRIPVCYDEAFAPDLEEAAARAGLTAAAFAALHAGLVHNVYMLGFLPGQPYLGDLPEALVLPRRASPRTKVAAGSVGIAQRMTCLFPRETPCGLNIIGRTPVRLWDARRSEPALMRPGDQALFEPVSLAAFARLDDAAAHGEPIAALTMMDAAA